jgi:hypothetical protein
MKTMFGRLLLGGLPVGGLPVGGFAKSSTEHKSSTEQRHSKPTSKQIQIETTFLEQTQDGLLKKKWI